MASFADCLRKILEIDTLTSPDEDGVLVLEEKESGQRAQLTGAPPDLVAVDLIKIGKMGQMSGLNKDGDWKKSCDYLLTFQENGNDRALLIELKKTLRIENKNRGMDQLRWTRPLLDYLRSVCEVRRLVDAGSLRVDVDYALISEQPHKSLAKNPVHEGANREPFKNIEALIVFGKKMLWIELLKD